ncbi:MAG TPA: dicarboxylate/amino acid:cation symporter [Vicinamibacteria bacterium]|jgi:DAACS family dicarboxylate/amino acid:cation (Na+ or H+) symporter
MPLYLRILVGVALGAGLGVAFDDGPILLGLRNRHLGELGMLVIRLLKALAVPLIFFAILDAFARTEFRARRGGKMVLICLLNVSVAFAIGLTLMNTWRPGEAWRGRFSDLLGGAGGEGAPAAPGATLDPLKNVDGYVPVSLLDPFSKNSVISVVLLSLFAGAALRRVRRRQQAEGETTVVVVERFVAAAYEVLVLMLYWVVQAIPFAVFGVVAQVVGRAGLQAFSALGVFLAVILLGLGLHALVYYPLMAWLVGGRPPQVYLGKGADAILMGLSTNSSLATVPVTLRCLTEKMGVSQESARLSACVGTNLNNDGITLYDAMAALFIAQACGFDLTLGQQGVVVMASLMAGVGIAGIPEAGLIVLPLVLGSVGLPEAVVAAAIPLVLPVDWIIGRARSVVNVMSDMLVAILLDRGRPAPVPAAAQETTV